MCIAVYKPMGQKMPSKKIFSNCFANNDDGAGFMFPHNGKVHIEKGFMSFTAFKRGLKDAIKRYGISPKDTPMVFHFRIQSQGGVRADLTHPFPVCKSYDTMRELSGDYECAVVHNGIIDFASSYSAKIDYSDTMEFTKEVVYPLVHKNPNYWKNKTLMGLLSYLLSGNMFLIMGGDGHVEMIGDWKEDNAIYYSNTSYSHKPYTRTVSVGSNWSSFKSVSDYGYDDVITRHDDLYITKEMEKEFLDNDCIHCECGEEMVIEYIWNSDICYAYCPECGMTYMLTRKAEEHGWAKGLIIVDDSSYDDYVSWNRSFGVKGGN